MNEVHAVEEYRALTLVEALKKSSSATNGLALKRTTAPNIDGGRMKKRCGRVGKKVGLSLRLEGG